MTIKLVQLAQKFGGSIIGDDQQDIKAIATLEQAGAGDITFLANRRYRHHLATTQASAVILKSADQSYCKTTAWVVKDPYVIYARVAQLLYAPTPVSPGIHPSAVIHPGADIDRGASIAANCTIGSNVIIRSGVQLGPGCVIGDGSRIDEGSRLVANVTIGCQVIIGKRALLHPGVVIGGDGFGFANEGGEWIKIPQIGSVIIGDDVEVGANTTIDRGALQDTLIGNGVKLDNQIQIGHNVQIGDHTAIASGAGVAGSTKIGKRCAIAGHVGIIGHLTITDDVQITAMSFVTSSIESAGIYSSGYPYETNRQWLKNTARLHQLDDLARRLIRLEKLQDN